MTRPRKCVQWVGKTALDMRITFRWRHPYPLVRAFLQVLKITTQPELSHGINCLDQLLLLALHSWFEGNADIGPLFLLLGIFLNLSVATFWRVQLTQEGILPALLWTGAIILSFIPLQCDVWTMKRTGVHQHAPLCFHLIKFFYRISISQHYRSGIALTPSKYCVEYVMSTIFGKR